MQKTLHSCTDEFREEAAEYLEELAVLVRDGRMMDVIISATTIDNTDIQYQSGVTTERLFHIVGRVTCLANWLAQESFKGSEDIIDD